MKGYTPVFIIAGLCLSLLCLMTDHRAIAQDKATIRISGAGLLSDVVDMNAAQYTQEAPNCSFVIHGATTGIGLQRLIAGDADLAMVTRKITEEETKNAAAKGIVLGSKYIGQIALAVITNSKNTVNELTMEQLAKIFKGEITNWSQVGGPNEPIRVTMRAVPETGAGVLFQDKVLKGAPYAKDATVMSTYSTTVTVCSRSFGIGYIPTTTVFFDKLDERGVKILKIKKDADSQPYQLAGGVSRESLYPISVAFHLYWNANTAGPCVQGFADFSAQQTQ
ncbi:MAG: substrate-binding domain-containing protein [Thermodesulfobacteriota bacterium]